MTNKDYMRMVIEKKYAERIERIAINLMLGNCSADYADKEVKRADRDREAAFEKIGSMMTSSHCYPEGN